MTKQRTRSHVTVGQKLAIYRYLETILDPDGEGDGTKYVLYHEGHNDETVTDHFAKLWDKEGMDVGIVRRLRQSEFGEIRKRVRPTHHVADAALVERIAALEAKVAEDQETIRHLVSARDNHTEMLQKQAATVVSLKECIQMLTDLDKQREGQIKTLTEMLNAVSKVRISGRRR